MTNIAGKAVLITGANRGIGQALVAEALARGASQVYAGTRAPIEHSDSRVRPVTLDVTSAEQIQAAVDAIGSLDLLINNAGIAGYDDLSDAEVIARHLEVNLYGTHAVTRAFTPLLARAGGAVVNNLSITAFAPLPLIPSYSISKAAALALTQSLRTLLVPQGVRVHAVLTGFVDTDMTRGANSPKATPASVAAAIFDGVEHGQDDIFPDAMSRPMADGWRTLAGSALEGPYAALAAELRAAA
ncbi:short-subunit dehydrogenase [Asanoa ferruginea]|uniref:Short-subunit dehydrogenase n=1 Tax=Asanoa ferruginea TaxID=53367 RepID=A0A3D9ZW15_9ACTN|nr:SDR family NAD(P)-dependent oxidoreductase [Asanoa ferruginea]REG01436.1 short-subunit dehydrogenase [Asanoa ferruginea]GIF47937.1 short-chain dehydrogenase/reductase [Asanoa ferruginea]